MREMSICTAQLVAFDGIHYVGLISARVLSFGEDCFLQVTWLLTVTHEQGTAADLAIEKRLLIMHAINHTSC